MLEIFFKEPQYADESEERKKVPKKIKIKRIQELFPKNPGKEKTENPEPNGIEEKQKPCIT